MSPPTWLYWPLILPSGTVTATGGTTHDEGGYRYHIFTSGGTFAVTAGGEVEVLLVAGGGAGARQSASGGGGGAGGVLLLDGVNALTVAGSINYTVTVGTGGVAVNANGTGANGTDSSFIGGSISETAIGGGGGQGNSETPGSGGSGGGGQGNNAAFGTGTSGQGSDGARGSSSGTLAGGGGGGASQAGTAGSSGAGGNGGDGSSIWGTLGGNAPGAYGGGGGGSTTTNAGGGLGGSGGGGRGQDGTTASTAGSANTGGGGGAGYPPSSGGSGIVIVRYPLSAAVLWVPSDISDLVVWLDADDTAFSNNDPVDSWTNKGTGGDADQTDSTKRPIFRTNLLNGKPGVDFDGTNDHLQISSLALDTYITVFVVAKTTTAKPMFIEHGPNTNTNEGFFFYGTTSSHYSVRRGSLLNSYRGISGWFGSEAAQAALVINAISSTPNPMGQVYLNGALQPDGTFTASASLSNSSVTDTLNIFSRNGASPFSDGDLHELIIYNKPLAQDDRKKVEGYLAHKWGLQGNLPNDHPYKSSPP